MKDSVFYIPLFRSIVLSMRILSVVLFTSKKDLSKIYTMARKYLRVFIGGGILIIMGSCSYSKIDESQNDLSERDLLKGYDLFGAAAENLILPDIDVLGLSPKMALFLEEHIPNKFSDRSKVRTILKAMIADHYLHMKYDVDTTLTASGAFEAKEGNCLGFSYLFVSFARARGLRVRFRQVDIPPEWSPKEEELHFLLRHLNVFVDIKFDKDVIVDIDQRRNKEYYPWRYMSDDQAVALYYGNMGVNFMVEDEKTKAFTYMVKALNLSPDDSFLWSNLGVLYRKHGLLKQAEKAYFIALSKKRNNPSALNNLQVLYEIQGQVERSEYYRKLAFNFQRQNPYYYYFQAKKAFKEGAHEEALSLIKNSIKRRSDEPLFHGFKEKIDRILESGFKVKG